jgi:hypothetical protein
MTNNKENKKFGLSARARKAFCATFLAGGLFGGQAVQAAVPAPTIPDRVAAVREQLYKRVADLGSPEAISKLPYSEMQVASWLNWVNWRDWNNWRNWNNWPNWFNY